MRSFVALLLSISLTLNAAIARASTEAVATTTANQPEAPPSTSRATEPSAVLKRIQTNSAVQGTAHSAQALLIMVMVAALASYGGELKQARLKDGSVDWDRVGTLVSEATEHILLGGSTWLGMMAGGVAGTAAAASLKSLQSDLDSVVKRPMMRNMVRSGLMSLIAFGAFETGAELWDEAHEMLQADADYDRAKRAAPAVLKTLVSPVTDNAQYENDRRIMGLVLQNMYTILVKDDDLRSDFIYNTWRKRIATGQFATLIGGTTAGAAIGSAIPGVGTVAGGIIGGTAAIAVPEKYNDAITDVVRDGRAGAGRIRTSTQVQALRELNSTMTGPSFSLDPELRQRAYLDATVDALETMEKRQDDAYTARIEKVYRANVRLNILMGNKKVAVDAGNTLAASNLNEDISDASASYRKSIDELVRYAQDETRRLDSLKAPRGQDQVADIYRHEKERLQRVSKAVTELGRRLQPGQPDAELAQGAKRDLTRFYISGFKSAKLLKSSSVAAAD